VVCAGSVIEVNKTFVDGARITETPQQRRVFVTVRRIFSRRRQSAAIVPHSRLGKMAEWSAL